MFLRYVRSKDGSTVTLSDGVTQVGAFPVLLDIDTTMAQTALQLPRRLMKPMEIRWI